jgi:hypothetical protein
MPATKAWLVEYDEPVTEDGMTQHSHAVTKEPEGHYADCALPLVSLMDVLNLGYMGWIPLSEQSPHFMSGFIALLHPDKDEPTLSYVGTHPGDFLEDGYTHYMPIARIPKEHLRHRRKAKAKTAGKN